MLSREPVVRGGRFGGRDSRLEGSRVTVGRRARVVWRRMLAWPPLCARAPDPERGGGGTTAPFTPPAARQRGGRDGPPPLLRLGHQHGVASRAVQYLAAAHHRRGPLGRGDDSRNGLIEIAMINYYFT